MSVPLPHEDLGASWRKARPRPAGRHLDSAASSRQSSRALEAAAHHARHEAELGGYVAEAAADDLLQQGRSVLGGLVGMAAADVAFVESAQSALAALLSGWRLPAGSRVACLPGEYAPTIAQLRASGLRPQPLPVDGAGRADVERIARLLREDPPSFVHLTQIGSHRGLLQPAAEVAAVCRDAGVPLVVDAAQSLGHVDVDLGADVVYGTSRKWLSGPRGVGMLFVRPALAGPAEAGAAGAGGRAADAGLRVGRGAHRRQGGSRRGSGRPPRRRSRAGAGTAPGARAGHP